MAVPESPRRDIYRRTVDPHHNLRAGFGLGTLSQAKLTGEIGSILVVLTGAPIVGAVFGTVGFVLVLVALKYISDALYDRSIFRNMLVSVVLAVAGLFLTTFVIERSALRFVGLRFLAGSQPFGPSFNPPIVAAGDWVGLFVSLLAVLFVVWMVLLGSGIYARKAYDLVAARLKQKSFGTSGFLYLVGSAATIAFFGFALILIAQILLVVAFFSMEEKLPAPSMPRIEPTKPSSPPTT